MKKNVMLKIASVLMVAVLLTTCAISSTFAKYVTTGANLKTVEAKVANWNLKITSSTNDKVPLFLDEYKNGDKVTVQGLSKNIVVAPGTSNETDAFDVAISGAPEVAYKLTVKFDLILAKWEVAEGKYYCPLAITVKDASGNEKVFYGNSNDTAAKFEEAVEDYVAGLILNVNAEKGETLVKDSDAHTYSCEYAPNRAVSAAANGVEISWAWAFDANTAAGQTNENDTILGNAADADKATIKFEYAVSAEQID